MFRKMDKNDREKISDYNLAITHINSIPMKLYILLLAIVFFLNGCATRPQIISSENSDKQSLITQLKDFIEKKKFIEASALTNLLIFKSPDSSSLHCLNGYIYDNRTDVFANKDNKKLAEIGYLTCLQLDPLNLFASSQLAQLSIRDRNYDLADKYIQQARYAGLDLDYYNIFMGTVEYYRQDFKKSTAFFEKVSNTPALYTILKTNYLVAEAAAKYFQGQDSQNRLDLKNYNDIEESELKRIKGIIRRFESSSEFGGQETSTQKISTMQNNNNMSVEKKPEILNSASSWFQCNQQGPVLNSILFPSGSSFTSNQSSASGNINADETSPLIAIPRPCDNTEPKRVIFDIKIIRTEDLTSESYGINVIRNLNLVYSKNRAVQSVSNPSSGEVITTTINTNRFFRNSINADQSSVLQYSLNIANILKARNEVIAEPTLTAIDQAPATFFSGLDITVGLQGAAGGQSTIQEKAIGLSLSLTPTILSDEQLLLSIKIAKSFLIPVDVNIGFNNIVQTTRNATFTNSRLRFGETLVLSGFSESSFTSLEDGVPYLRKIPFYGLFFGTRNIVKSNVNTMLLITPRLNEPQTITPKMTEKINNLSPLGGILIRDGDMTLPNHNIRFQDFFQEVVRSIEGS